MASRISLCSLRSLFALLALLLASLLLLLAAALLLTFLVLLASASSEATDEPLGLIRNSSNGVLHSLHRLAGLVGYLAGGILRSSTLLLALLLLLRIAGLGGARLLYGLLGLGGRGDLQVEEAPVGS